MHAAELTFTPARGTQSTLPMAQQQTTTTSSWFATATYTAPAMAPARPAPLLHHPLALHAPAPSPGLSAYDDTGSRNVPEYLTRRFVEKATQARMALLKKRLAEGSARLLAVQRGASFSSRPSSTFSSPAPWSRSSSPQAVPAWRPASARPSRATSPSPSSARPRSATPGGTSRRGADLDLFGQRNPLVNDFIQVPVAGTYRHLGKQYDTDYTTMQDRLQRLEQWCRQFKQTYSPKPLHPALPRQQLPIMQQPLAAYVMGAQVTPRSPVAAAPSLKAAGTWAGGIWGDSEASTPVSRAGASPAPTVAYSPALGAVTPTRVPGNVFSASASPHAASAKSTARRVRGVPLHAPLTSFAHWPPSAAHELAAEQRRARAGRTPGSSVGPASARLAHDTPTLSAPFPTAPATASFRVWPNPDVLPARVSDIRRTPVPGRRRGDMFTSSPSPPRQRGQQYTPADAGWVRHHSPPPLAAPSRFPVQAPSISSTLVETGTSVASHGGLEPWADVAGSAWEQMYQLPQLQPTWVEPAPLVPRSSLLKFAAAATPSVLRRTGDAVAPYSPVAPRTGLSPRERLQAGIRDLQSEVHQLRQDLGRSGVSVSAPELGTDLRRSTVPPPASLWG